MSFKPTSKDDWQIYDEEGCEEVAQELTKALEAAEVELTEGTFKVKDDPVHKVIKNHLYPLFAKHSKFGTSDSEVYYVALNYLIKVLKKIKSTTFA